MQTTRHPAPFFAMNPAVQLAQPLVAPDPAPVPEQRLAAVPIAQPEVTGSVAPIARPVIPDIPVGNKQAFAVQKKLSELGLFEGTVDGFYGPMTARAIRAFEERNGFEPTGALTQSIVDAILRADSAGRAQQAVVAQPVARQVAVVQTAPTPAPAPQQDQVVARLPDLSPVDVAVDTVGNAAASTIDSIVAVVGGSRSAPTPQGANPMPPVALAQQTQPMPAPVQVAALEPTASQQVAVTAVDENVAPANNVQLVTNIQRGLASLGFYHGSIDGHPGDATARAIREFENFHSFKVTGQIKPDLIGLLRNSGATI
jgi:peptidoglycan hydrolase-like protein with peptidoglycan-binding domain